MKSDDSGGQAMFPQHASRKNGIELSAKNQVETFN